MSRVDGGGHAGMARRGRKPLATRDDLLGRIIDHLAERGIAKATFRSLATSLGMSTYPLVYYFGSKEQLLRAVVAEVEHRLRDRVDRRFAEGDLLSPWQWCLDNQDLLRLDFEILLHERESPDRPLAHRVFRDWHRLFIERFEAEGLSAEEAEVEATLFVGTVVGLQLDLITTRDTDRTTRAYRRHVQRRADRRA